MRKQALISVALVVAMAASVVLARDQQVQAVIGNVFLQNTTPGTVQVGHAAISGTFRAGQVNVSQSTASTIPVIGNNNSTGPGNAIGGSFSSGQQSGIALRATATSTTGFNIGLLGEARSPNGTGVTGRSSTGIGVFGLTEGTGAGIWARSTSALAPALICENTVNRDAARMFGSLQMMNFSPIFGLRGDGSVAYHLAANADQTLLTLLGPGSALTAVSNKDFASLSMRRGVQAGVTLFVNQVGAGSVQADVKNFVQPDPDSIDRDIVYASVEGPEAAAYVRGTATLVNGVAVVKLPRHFQNVATSNGMTVQLTPLSRSSRGLAVMRKSKNEFSVGELMDGHGNYAFDWEVKAVRRGFTDYKVYRRWESQEDRIADLASRRAKAREVYGIDYEATGP